MSIFTCKTVALRTLLAAALLPTLVLTSSLSAQTVIHQTTTGTIYTVDASNAVTSNRVKNGSVEFDIDDGVTLTVGMQSQLNTGDQGGIYCATSASGNQTFTVKPTGILGTGTTIFQGLGMNYSQGTNKYGGAFYIATSSVAIDITNALFTGFYAGAGSGVGNGGVMYIGTSTIDMQLKNVVFSNNFANGGGAVMYVTGYTGLYKLNFTDVDFHDNNAGTLAVPAPYGTGGAISIPNGGATGSFLRIINTNPLFGFSRNTLSTSSAGTASAYGGAIYANSVSLDLRNINFSNNTAIGVQTGNTAAAAVATAYGGAIYSTYLSAGGTISIINDNFTKNIASMNHTGVGGATAGGGGLAIYAVSPNISVLVDTGTYVQNSISAIVASSSNANANGGAFYLSGTITDNYTLKNLVFNSNTSSANSVGGAANAVGGALYLSNIVVTATNLSFSNNAANAVYAAAGKYYSQGGAVYLYNSSATFTNVDFENNTAQTGGGGLYASGTAVVLTINNGTFGGNSVQGTAVGAAGQGGGLYLSAGGKATLNNVVFNNNITSGTGGQGGAIYLSGTNMLTLNATVSASSAGNQALGAGAGAGGSNGGFLYIDGSNNIANINVANNATLTIGNAANVQADSIVSGTSTGNSININTAAGSTGALVLNGNSALNRAPVTVQAGALYLGNNNAALGGAITVNSGATFGGGGTIATSLALNPGATLAAGVSGNASALSLAIAGNLILTSNTLSFGHFGSGTNDNIAILGTLNSTGGSNTLNLIGISSGTYTLMTTTGIGGSTIGNFSSVLVNGGAIAGRKSANVYFSGNNLLAAISISNTTVTWTGADTAVWQNGIGASWNVAGDPTDHNFLSGDKVLFDSTSDSANISKRAITVDGAGVNASELDFSGAGNYTFTGGAITTSTNNTTITAASAPNIGKLVKSGSGTLTFANSGNMFTAGIDLSGGTIAFNSAAQLATGTNAGINVLDNATLATNLASAGTISLGNALSVLTGKTLGIDTTKGGLALTGTITGAGNIFETGAQDLIIAGNASALSGTTNVTAGRLVISSTATLGGAIAIANGATLAGNGKATGNVTAANGSTIQVGSTGIGGSTSGTLTLGGLNLQGATLIYGLYAGASGGYNNSDQLNLSSLLTASGTNIIDLTGAAQPGTYLLGKNMGTLDTAYSGTTIVTLGGASQIPGARQGASLSTSGNDLLLIYQADTSRIMTWTGSTTSTWNISDDNWTDRGTTTKFGSGDQVIFDATGAAHNQVSIAGSAQQRVSDMTVTGSTSYTFTGQGINADPSNMVNGSTLTPTGKLYKAGSGTLAFNNAANYFANGVEISGGAISFTDATQLTTSNTAAIHFSGSGGALQSASTGQTLVNTLLIDAGATGAINTLGNALAATGSLIGSGLFAKTGSGTLNISGDATAFTGTTHVSGGVLQLGADNAIGNNATLLLTSTGSFDINGHNQTLNALTTGTATTLNLGSAATGTLTLSTGGTVRGALSGAGVLYLATGLLDISGTSTSSDFTGNVRTSANTAIILNNAAGLGGGTVNLVGTSTIAVNGTNAATMAAKLVSTTAGAGVVAFNGTGTTTMSVANTNFTGTTQVNAGRVILSDAKALGGSQVTVATPANLEVAATGTFASSIAGTGTLNFTKATTVTGTNTIANIRVDNSGNLTALSMGALGNAATKVTINNGTVTIGLAGMTVSNVAITGNGKIAFSNLGIGNVTINNLAATGSAATLAFNTNVDAGTANTITTNNITGPYWIALTNTGTAPTGNVSIPLVITSGSAAQYRLANSYIDFGGATTSLATLASGPGATLQIAASNNLSPIGNSIVNTAGATPLTWFSELDTLQKRLGEIRFDTRVKPGYETWLRGYAQRLNVDGRATGAYNAAGFSEDQYGVEIGADYGALNKDTDASFYLGAFAGYGSNSRTMDESMGDSHMNSIYGGLYLTYVTVDGWYVDGTLKYNSFRNHFNTTAAGLPASANYNNNAMGLSVEGGKRIKFGAAWYVEPQVQFAFTQYSGVQYTTTNGFPVMLNQGNTTQARAGVEIGYTGTTATGKFFQPYVKMLGTQQWSSGGVISMSGSVSLAPQIQDGHFTTGGGVNWVITKQTQVYFDYEYSWAKQYTKPYGLTAGIRHQW